MNPVWFDREEILELLDRRVQSFLAGYRQNLAILGPEGVGKTTLLKRLLERRILGSSAVAIILSVPEQVSIPEWSVRFIQALFYGVLQAKGCSTWPADLPTLLRMASKWIPKAVRQAERLLGHATGPARGAEIADSLWDLPAQVTQELGVPCLLVLDEFDRLNNFPLVDPFGRLGRRIMTQSTTMYLMTSSRPRQARSILREGLNLLFGQFDLVDLAPLPPAVCRKGIHTLWVSDSIDPFLEHLVMELAQGYPAYLDLLVRGLSHPPEGEALSDPEGALLGFLESELFDSQGTLRVRFESKVRQLPAHRDRLTWVQVLEAVAQGFHRVGPIAQEVHRSPPQVRRALELLEQVGLVSKQGVFYRIPDRLLRLWMVTAYPVLQGVGLADSEQARARFRDLVSGWVRKLEETVRRPIEQQASVLLRQWDGEWVELEGRRMLLPRWERVELIPGSLPFPSTELAHRTVLVTHRGGTEEGKSWLVVPWVGPFQELQALRLARDLFRPPFKTYRKVLLGAEPVEMNARLILKEAQIHLWDLPTANLLLDLYGLGGIPLPEVRSLPLGETVVVMGEALPGLKDPQVQQAS